MSRADSTLGFKVSRRSFIRSSVCGAAGLMLPPWVLGQSLQFSSAELKIPEPLTAPVTEGVKHFSLTARRGQQSFFSSVSTPTMGLNGNFHGPTLFFNAGDDVAITVENQLNEKTTLHWHGLHVPALADGGPAQVIEHGESWNPAFKVDQRGGTFWYHSHLLGKTGEQVYAGLSGLIIIEDEETKNANLPSTYGVDDIPLLVQDRRFNEDGSFSYISSHRDIMTGLFGDTVLVNGTVAPRFIPTTSKVRFRLLNCANARTFNFAFDDDRKFELLASDGGLLSEVLSLSNIILAPSERAEIIVDFSDGEPVNLVSKALPDSSPFSTRGMMRNMHPMNTEQLQILAIEPQSTLDASPKTNTKLSVLSRIPETEAVKIRQLTLGMVMGMGRGMAGGTGRSRNQPSQGQQSGMMGGTGNFFINNQAMDMSVINQRVKMGDTEIWEITNDTMMMHPFHIHHSQFQILDRNGASPRADEMGFKDTVKVGPGEKVRFIMRFESFSDSQTPYMYHCHILEHEDNGMMGQFVVE